MFGWGELVIRSIARTAHRPTPRTTYSEQNRTSWYPYDTVMPGAVHKYIDPVYTMSSVYDLWSIVIYIPGTS